MNYEQALQWMYARLPMFQRQGAAAYKKDLGNISLLVKELGNPHIKFKSIHVAGTNGKGSTSHMLASTLQEAGYKVGLYTSPHLKDFRERIRINGEMVSKDFVVDFITMHQKFLKENELSFFELTVGMAFAYFAKAKVDVAVIEVGLGGRLDATNIIKPEVSVITNIGLDHTAFLGTTIPEIAAEKAGIIKTGVPVVIGEKQPGTIPIFVKKAAAQQCRLYVASDADFPDYESDLKGMYQQKNKKTVLKTLEVLQAQGRFLIPEKAIRDGLAHVVKNTGLQGRWQVLRKTPKVICDTGHNREGLELVLQQLQQEDYNQLHIVLGMVVDKDLDSILPQFPRAATYYFCKPDLPRGLEALVLQHKAAEYQLKGETYVSVKAALKSALACAKANDLIFVGGSTFVVAEVL